MLKLLIKILSCFFIVFFFVKCIKKENKSINPLVGHWHNRNDIYDLTLDIDDSFAILNKFSLLEYPEIFPLYDSVHHRPSLPIPCGCGSAVLPVVDKFQIIGDTLIYDNEIAEECYAYTPFKFIRCNIENCKWADALPRQYVSLKKFDEVRSKIVDLDSLRSKSIIINIAVGYPKSEEFRHEPKIQSMDLFIEPTDIPRLIAEEKSFYRQSKIIRPMVVCLVVDNSVPKDYLNCVMASISKKEVSEVLHLVTIGNGNRLGFEKLVDW
jgi:hypothetical protein